ncbi:hypothetical protein JN11_04249 [Mucilaginibacter frigoritolerans]|uniref:Uncharacterized protein n=1 Tax=Mucilaginibacter frigoritolerans TaxID=652788 RepID=A0A562TRZ5_9SPHI|nr:hypothetical protein JN11_04249 [Mucilaginibacter frigoritolerans]
MSIIFLNSNSQSFGVIGEPYFSETPATPTSYRTSSTTFSWWYKNSYDDNSGKARAIITKIYNDNQILFTCHVYLENGNVLAFSGYKQR